MVDLADIVIRVDSTQLVGASTATQSLQKNTLALLASLSRAGGATLQYQREVKLLNDAQAQGIITNNELSRSLRQLETRYNSMGLAVDKAGRLMESSQAGANRFGHTVQQVGYQVGDFFVQVQSGTNFMVAFGQQATQLAGLIPGVLGAALGIGISLFTAIGATLMRSSESAGTFQDAMKSANDVLSETESILKIVNGDFDQLREKFGSLSPSIMALVDTRADIALRNIADAAKSLRNELTEMYNGNVWLNVSRAEDLGAAFRFGTQATRELAAAMENLKNQDTLQGQVEAATRLRELFLSMAGPVEQMTSDELAFYLAIVDAEEATRELHRRTVEVQTTTGGLLDLMRLFRNAADEAAGAVGAIAAEANVAAGFVSRLAGAMWEAAQTRITATKALETMKIEFSAGGQAMEKYAGRSTQSTRKIEDGFGNVIQTVKKLGGGGRGAVKEAFSDAEKAAKDFANTMDGYVVSAVGGVADAFGDFITRGFRDFKGFVKDVIGSFKNMIAQMIAIALKNKILIGLGFATAGAGGAGAIMGSGFGTSGLGGMISTAASGFGSGFMSSITGGFGGMTGAIGGGLSAGGIGGVATAIGAIAAPLLAVAGIFSFFKKKTKELDSGLRITVGNMDALVETFRTVQTTRFFGLSKKVKTTVEEASAEVSDPVVKAIQDIQTQVIKAAEMFGIAESEFEDFVYKFDVSLKGLTDEQKIQKINEELLKMGDAFASLSGHFTSMNELLAAAQQRYDLQTRLLELQGDTEALLARQRELELAAVHDLNRELLLQIHALEDQQRALQAYQQTLNETTQALEEANRAYESALGDLRGAMARQLSEAQSALDSAKSVFDTALSNRYESLQNNLSSTEQALADAQQALAEAQRRAFEEGIQNRIAAVNASFNSLIAGLEARLDVAQRKAAASREVFEALDSALRDRRLASDAATFASRRSALSYVSSGGTDIDKLTSALGILNEPSEQFFGTFQDYARDFALTTNAIKDSAAVAEATMTADEKTVMLLEQQIEQSRASQEAQVEALEKMLVVQEDFLTVSQAMEQLLAAQENYDQAKEAHDELLLQYPQLQETFISVGDALASYLAAQATYEQVQAQHAELVAQFPMLNESVLTVAQAVTNLRGAIAAQAAATAAQTAAQAALANAIAAANQAATTEAVPGFAVGGMHIGGPRIVGENGPELEVTGPSRIYSNRDTASMFRDPNLASAVDGLRKEVSGMRSEQLQIQVEVSKNVKRIYDIERKWDTDGLPPERV